MTAQQIRRALHTTVGAAMTPGILLRGGAPVVGMSATTGETTVLRADVALVGGIDAARRGAEREKNSISARAPGERER